MNVYDQMIAWFPHLKGAGNSKILEVLADQWGLVCAKIKENADSIGNIRIEQMTGPRGTQVKNQFIIYAPEGTYFQSYSSLIAFKRRSDGKITLDANTWDYSTTTGKYRNEFLREGIEETRKKIKDGTYQLADLNRSSR